MLGMLGDAGDLEIEHNLKFQSTVQRSRSRSIPLMG